MWYRFKPYVSVAKRREEAAAHAKKMLKSGVRSEPVVIEGRTIATTFWGKAWCDNLEQFSDFENRMPRGRTYVRYGSVFHLAIEPRQVTALVSGSEIYEVSVTISMVKPAHWQAIKQQCAGKIGSLFELLQGKVSKHVMESVTRKGHGLFPVPGEMEMTCSCPDYAGMCKHIAAAMYGVGARLDRQPELLFTLRGVDPAELLATDPALTLVAGEDLDRAELADVFGINLSGPASAPTKPAAKAGKGANKAATPAKARAAKPAPAATAKPAKTATKGTQQRAKPTARKKATAKVSAPVKRASKKKSPPA